MLTTMCVNCGFGERSCEVCSTAVEPASKPAKKRGMNLPSVQTLCRLLRLEESPARCVRLAMEEYRDGRRTLRMTMQEADRHLIGHGVEYLRSNCDTFRSVNGIEYVNMGDPYRMTLLFDHASERFSVGCWGDVVERDERRFGEEG